jgi:hypothetical protein
MFLASEPFLLRGGEDFSILATDTLRCRDKKLIRRECSG